ncbi:Uncharacterised protein [Segatella copri]|nr:Uncharacterised protein [Segatella copri]
MRIFVQQRPSLCYHHTCYFIEIEHTQMLVNIHQINN